MIYKFHYCSIKSIDSSFRFAKMKTIFGVIFFGILTFAFADYPPLKECKHPPPMSNFNSESFLEGIWYVTNAQHGSNSTVCRRYKTSLTGDTVKLNGDGYYTFNGQKPFFKVRCKGKKTKTEHTCGKFSLKCTQSGGGLEGGIKFELEITILETDYNNFAVMYRCVEFPPKLGSRIEDNVLVLHRNQGNTNDLDSRISATLTKHNLKLDEFISNKDVKCLKPPKKNKGKS